MIEIYFYLVSTVASHVICSPKNQREMRIDGYILMATIMSLWFLVTKPSHPMTKSPPNQKLVDLM